MRFFLISVIIFCQFFLNAQISQIDMDLLNQKRIESILTNDSISSNSYSIRFATNNWDHFLKANKNNTISKFKWLFAGYGLQSNNNLPVGFNDGNLIPNVGLQEKFTFGAQFNTGPLSILVQPEYIKAQNFSGTEFLENRFDINYRRSFYWYIRNKIDNSTRIGNQSYSQLFWGQTSIRLNSKKLSIGISSENIWWGPGSRNSLLLTNHAPGFKHISFNTREPINTKLGLIEFQIIAGNIDSSISPSIDFDTFPPNITYRELKSNAPRGIAGYFINWKPKWFKHLTFGLGGMTYFYKKNPNVLPSTNLIQDENQPSRANLSSLFFRYAIPSENAEFYMEYGINGKFFAPFNIIGDTIPTAYTVGFRKYFKLSKRTISSYQSALMVSIELTQLQLPDNRLIFNPSDPRGGVPRTQSWYTHPFIKQGYTNQGQILGASIGPGSNSQTLYLSWIKGLKKVGLSVERILYNSDFYQYHFYTGRIGRSDPSYYWVDINAGIQFQWDFNKILLNASYLYTSALNYRWTKLDGGFANPSTLSDKRNHQLSFSLHYLLFK